MSDKKENENKTEAGFYYKKKVYYEDEFHDRHVTVAVILSNSNKILVGMSICYPEDKEKKSLGRHIALKRAEARYDQKSKHEKAVKALRAKTLHKVLIEDSFFLKQIGRSFFFDFKSNPEKYIAAYENE